jgi:hypothetical protein
VKYSLDTSSLIEPWHRLYPPDVTPRLWDELLPDLIAAGELRAIQEVRIELEQQDDALLAWATSQTGLFVEIDADVQIAVKEVMRQHAKLVDINSARSGADPFVIAFALVNGGIVVCEEKPRSPINPKIPDVCSSLGVRCMKMLDLIREEAWSFH